MPNGAESLRLCTTWSSSTIAYLGSHRSPLSCPLPLAGPSPPPAPTPAAPGTRTQHLAPAAPNRNIARHARGLRLRVLCASEGSVCEGACYVRATACVRAWGTRACCACVCVCVLCLCCVCAVCAHACVRVHIHSRAGRVHRFLLRFHSMSRAGCESRFSHCSARTCYTTAPTLPHHSAPRVLLEYPPSHATEPFGPDLLAACRQLVDVRAAPRQVAEEVPIEPPHLL